MRLTCIECKAVSDERADAWEAHLVDSDDGDGVVLFCPSCARREFNDQEPSLEERVVMDLLKALRLAQWN
jgi:hypothetical protein